MTTSAWRARAARERVENYRGGIGARFLFDHFDAGAARPDFQLFDGGGAESVGGAEDHAGAFFFQAIGEFADGGGLAGAVDADDEQDARFVGWSSIRGVRIGLRGRRCGENFQDLIFQFAFQRAGFYELVLVHLLAQRGEDFLGGAHAEVSAEQRGFELFQQLGIDGAVAREQLFDARG